MINATIDNITINDEELFNRVRAYAAGDGINRPAVTLEDAASIAAYGVREIVQEFPEATSYDDLVGKATSFLDEAKNPVTEVDVTFFYDTEKGPGSNIYEGTALTHDGETFEYYTYTNNREVRRGDTIRIVSQSLGLNFTGVIEELDWEPGSVSLSIGRKRYNLLDVVNGRRLAAERGEAALGLEKPISFRAIEGSPGVVVSLNPYVSQRAVGVEIYGDTSEDSLNPASGEISREFLLSRGVATRVELTQLNPGQTYYFRARSYDDAGNYSELTDTISADSGFVKSGTIGNGEVKRNNIDGGAVGSGQIENGAVSTDKLEADSISADKIQAGAINADKISSGSITADKIVAGEIKTDKFAFGNVIIDDEQADNPGEANRIRVVNDAQQNQVIMGYIGDISSVPVDYGLYGTLGSGIYIEGVPRVLDIYSQSVSASFTAPERDNGTEIYYGWKFSIPVSSLNFGGARASSNLFILFTTLPSLYNMEGNPISRRDNISSSFKSYNVDTGSSTRGENAESWAGFTYDDSFSGLIAGINQTQSSSSIIGPYVSSNNLSNLKIAGYYYVDSERQTTGFYNDTTISVSGKVEFVVFESDTDIESGSLSGSSSTARY